MGHNDHCRYEGTGEIVDSKKCKECPDVDQCYFSVSDEEERDEIPD